MDFQKGDGPFSLPKVQGVTLPETNIALPETNSSHLEMHGWKVRSFPFGFWLASVFFSADFDKSYLGLKNAPCFEHSHHIVEQQEAGKFHQ